jgi:hypothetical protein
MSDTLFTLAVYALTVAAYVSLRAAMEETKKNTEEV